MSVPAPVARQLNMARANHSFNHSFKENIVRLHLLSSAAATGIIVLLGLSPSEAAAKPAAKSKTATAVIDVSEVSKDSKAHAMRFETPLTRDQAGSHLETGMGDASYRIDLDWRTLPDGRGGVTLSFEKDLPGNTDTKVGIRNAVVPMGRKTVLSTVTRPDGTSFELALTLR